MILGAILHHSRGLKDTLGLEGFQTSPTLNSLVLNSGDKVRYIMTNVPGAAESRGKAANTLTAYWTAIFNPPYTTYVVGNAVFYKGVVYTLITAPAGGYKPTASQTPLAGPSNVVWASYYNPNVTYTAGQIVIKDMKLNSVSVTNGVPSFTMMPAIVPTAVGVTKPVGPAGVNLYANTSSSASPVAIVPSAAQLAAQAAMQAAEQAATQAAQQQAAQQLAQQQAAQQQAATQAAQQAAQAAQAAQTAQTAQTAQAVAAPPSLQPAAMMAAMQAPKGTPLYPYQLPDLEDWRFENNKQISVRLYPDGGNKPPVFQNPLEGCPGNGATNCGTVTWPSNKSAPANITGVFVQDYGDVIFITLDKPIDPESTVFYLSKTQGFQNMRLTAPASIIQGFQSYGNPYNSSPMNAQALEFRLGQTAMNRQVQNAWLM